MYLASFEDFLSAFLSRYDDATRISRNLDRYFVFIKVAIHLRI